MEVDDDDLRGGPGLLDEVVEELERAHRSRHEEDPLQIHDGHRCAVRGLDDREPAPRRAHPEVRGPDDAVGAVEVRHDLAPSPDVVTEGEHVRARRQKPIGKAGSHARSVGHVLGVDDAEADL